MENFEVAVIPSSLKSKAHISLTGHVDKVLGWVVLFSLGNTCMFWIKGPLMEKKTAVKFESGDVLVFNGGTEVTSPSFDQWTDSSLSNWKYDIFHGIDDILPNTCPEHFPELKECRISLQLRFAALSLLLLIVFFQGKQKEMTTWLGRTSKPTKRNRTLRTREKLKMMTTECWNWDRNWWVNECMYIRIIRGIFHFNGPELSLLNFWSSFTHGCLKSVGLLFWMSTVWKSPPVVLDSILTTWHLRAWIGGCFCPCVRQRNLRSGLQNCSTCEKPKQTLMTSEEENNHKVLPSSISQSFHCCWLPTFVLFLCVVLAVSKSFWLEFKRNKQKRMMKCPWRRRMKLRRLCRKTICHSLLQLQTKYVSFSNRRNVLSSLSLILFIHSNCP